MHGMHRKRELVSISITGLGKDSYDPKNFTLFYGSLSHLLHF